jgi:AraC family transcriptional regulator, ethanolamine operon transcriptional activator
LGADDVLDEHILYVEADLNLFDVDTDRTDGPCINMASASQNTIATDQWSLLNEFGALGSEHRHFAFETRNVMRIASNDADEFSEAVRDWSVELKPVQTGGFDAHLLAIPLDEALIWAARFCQPLLQQVAAPDECLSIGRPGRGSDPVWMGGHEVASSDVLVFTSGAEIELINRGVHYPTALSLKVSFLRTQADWLDDLELLLGKSVQLRSPGPEWTRNFLDAMEWIATAVENYPEIVTREDVRRSVLDTLLARVNTLGAAAAPLSSDRGTRCARRLAVARAREYIDINLAEPIRLSDLCKHARTQARSLEYGFHEVVGLSPIAYVRATRLHRVRQHLRSAVVRTRSISEIALDCGFWHLSQFAVDYKRLFTESPSVTYRRTQAQLPRIERRSLSTIGSNALATRSIRERAAVPASA